MIRVRLTGTTRYVGLKQCSLAFVCDRTRQKHAKQVGVCLGTKPQWYIWEWVDPSFVGTPEYLLRYPAYQEPTICPPEVWYTQEFLSKPWFVPEHRAKVWTNIPHFCSMLTRRAEGKYRWDQTTWSAYEVVHPDGRTEPLTEFLTGLS